jgi:hypothetical protein
MDQVIIELKELRRKNEHEMLKFRMMNKFEDVLSEFKNHVIKGRTKPSNIRNRKYYGSTIYNWCLYYFGY